MIDAYTHAVERLSRVTGVLGALIVEAQTAVPVVAELREGVNGTAVAALAASLYQRTSAASESAEYGAVDTVQLEADDGHVIMVGAGEVILVIISERTAQLGMVRLEARRAAASLT
jgi:predicted regulator of Ras-like GTPase activity (Roadblock/LC7/MglB family)